MKYVIFLLARKNKLEIQKIIKSKGHDWQFSEVQNKEIQHQNATQLVYFPCICFFLSAQREMKNTKGLY